MLLSLLATFFLVSQATQVVISTKNDKCSSFTLSGPSVDAVVVNTTFYEANDTISISNLFSSINVHDLPAFCRVSLVITTNFTSNSAARTEIWLPESWNGRFVGFGNGGFGGGVNVADLGFIAIKQGFAGMSTDTGHSSNSRDGSWAGPGNNDAIIDWSWRAMHLSTVVGKEVVQQYYNKPHKKAYYMGCSTGGRQGLKEAQRFPADFDGIVIGSPANRMSHLMAWETYVNQQISPVNSPRFIPAETWVNVIHPEVLRQCDALDGLEDGILNDPRKCRFRPETLSCTSSQNSSTSTCLNDSQIAAINNIYSDYFDSNHTFVFDGYLPGGEVGYPNGLVGLKPFEIPGDYYKYFVLNDTSFTPEQLNDTIIHLGEEINPGSMDIVSPDLTSFLGPSRNGKILHYVGWADELISVGNSIRFYEEVKDFTEAKLGIKGDDVYRLFTVPGLQHCRGGFGANAFGGPSQAALGMPPASFDAQHNVLAAMVQWTEEGIAPETLMATYWKDNNVTKGSMFTRPLCKYPKMLIFKGGNPDTASSFECV